VLPSYRSAAEPLFLGMVLARKGPSGLESVVMNADGAWRVLASCQISETLIELSPGVNGLDAPLPNQRAYL
jgi:hypothetical protein